MELTETATDGLVIRRVALEGLHIDPSNARTHPERNLEAIRASLARFGQAEPLVVQKATGRVIGGNGRLVAMRALGWKEADVVELNLTETQATALGIALNRTSELADWDLPTLARLLECLQADGSLDGVGYSEKEVEDLLEAVIAANQIETSEDDVPGLPTRRPPSQATCGISVATSSCAATAPSPRTWTDCLRARRSIS